jgi:putative ATPase
MKDLGYGAGQEYLPDALRGARWYDPTELGCERTVAERLGWWEERKRRAKE